MVKLTIVHQILWPYVFAYLYVAKISCWSCTFLFYCHVLINSYYYVLFEHFIISRINNCTNLPGKTSMKQPASPPTTAIASPMFGIMMASAREAVNHTRVKKYRRIFSTLELSFAELRNFEVTVKKAALKRNMV